MELVEKNILPVESSLKEAIIGEEAQATLYGLHCEGGGSIVTEGTEVASGFRLLLADFLSRPEGGEDTAQSMRA